MTRALLCGVISRDDVIVSADRVYVPGSTYYESP
jgi:hypothetical protein